MTGDSCLQCGEMMSQQWIDLVRSLREKRGQTVNRPHLCDLCLLRAIADMDAADKAVTR